MRTSDEYTNALRLSSRPMEFARFAMSRSALLNALKLFTESGGKTTVVEAQGAAFAKVPTPSAAFKLSEAVCDWGRGQRVWANLRRLNGDAHLSKQLAAWLRDSIEEEDAEAAISHGTEIKGLGVSFASKHLRMLAPRRFPVLDQVLSEGLGIALNPRGYALFHSMLDAFQRENKLRGTIAQIEAGIFMLVRQHVRSRVAEDDA